MSTSNSVKLITAILICLASGLAGSVFTLQSIPTWYAALQKPSFAPPNYLFGPVWTILYILMGISAYLVWKRGVGKKEVKSALFVFAIQLMLNVTWSLVFFGLQNPFYALMEIALLWIAILFTIVKFYKMSKTAAYLLAPYILWVSFAAFLNYWIWQLNM